MHQRRLVADQRLRRRQLDGGGAGGGGGADDGCRPLHEGMVSVSDSPKPDRQTGSDLQTEIASPRDQHIYVPVRWTPPHYLR